MDNRQMKSHEKKNVAMLVVGVIAFIALVFAGGKWIGEQSDLQEIADTAVLAPVIEPPA